MSFQQIFDILFRQRIAGDDLVKGKTACVRVIAFKYPERKAVGKCPICGGAVVEVGSAYLCENQKRDDPNSCTFWFAKKIGGSIISTEEAVNYRA